MTDALCIAIVHYHLRAGGVTSVIRQTVSALENESCRIAVLAGTPAGPAMPRSTHCAVVDGLNYATTVQPSCSPDVLAARLEETACKVLGGSPDIWHFHNHSLGKNCALPMAIGLMAKQGKRVLLQIHDFPEDGRPSNYRALLDEVGDGDPLVLGARLYPQAVQVHYAVLNERDAGFLRAAGCFDDRVHLLPNAVSVKPPRNDDSDDTVSAGRRTFLVDFGRLDEGLQEQVIRRLLNAPARVSELKPSSLLPQGPPEQVIEMNRGIVQRIYNPEQYSRRLMDIYRNLMDSEVVPVGGLRAGTLLDKFLAPERFYLIRS